MTDTQKLKEQVESSLKEQEASVEKEVVETPTINVSSKELSEFESKMIEKGWDPSGEKTAEQWLDDGFEIRGKRVDSLYKTVDYLKNKMERDEKEAYQRALNSLKAEKVRAIELSDVNRVEEIERQQASMLDPNKQNLIVEFENRHSDWLKGTSHLAQKMSEAALNRFSILLNSGMTTDKQLESLENYMMGEFPEYFGKTQTSASQAVEGSQSPVVRTGKSKKSYSVHDLSDIQKNVAKTLERKGIMKVEDYIKDLVKLGDL